MSIGGSLACAGLVLLTLGVVVSARRAGVSSPQDSQAATSRSDASPVDDRPAASSSSTGVGNVLLMTGVVVLLAAGVTLVATWALFTGLF